eukprot:CAMPEP_0175094788 /NCGR_PEP_ID=MMETSP0086_2-20121207/3791_1 /TAXON_ID=136419 /ORGANISM="Unknown Unknown, Strain D1" /LENGTH=144 /DNA_ID=CAMNT_0016367957 /DNA_START=170 /DNA_END=604 /DNA_ORIENTATION=+
MYKQRRTDIQLQVEVESIPNDPSLLLLVSNLEFKIQSMQGRKTRKLSAWYIRLVNSVDRLMFLKDSVKSDVSKSGFEEIEFGYLQFRRVQELSRSMVEYASQVLPPADAADLGIALKKISTKTEAHFSNILFMLRKVPVHLNVN